MSQDIYFSVKVIADSFQTQFFTGGELKSFLQALFT
jgi:hypothetical protein